MKSKNEMNQKRAIENRIKYVYHWKNKMKQINHWNSKKD